MCHRGTGVLACRLDCGFSAINRIVGRNRFIAPSASPESEAPAAIAPSLPSARPTGLELSRAGLLSILAREPTVCRSVGLVR